VATKDFLIVFMFSDKWFAFSPCTKKRSSLTKIVFFFVREPGGQKVQGWYKKKKSDGHKYWLESDVRSALIAKCNLLPPRPSIPSNSLSRRKTMSLVQKQHKKSPAIFVLC